MNLLYYTESAKFGGAEVYLLKLAEQAKHLGHSVTVLVPPENERLIASLKTIDVRVEEKECYRREASEVRSLVGKFLQSETVDLLHVNLHWSTCCVGAMRAASDCKIPFLLTFHTRMPSGALGRMACRRLRNLYRQAAGRITVSHENVGNMCEVFGMGESEFDVIYNGVSVEAKSNASHERLRIRRELGLENDKLTGIFIGRLSEEKGCRWLLDIAAQLGPEWTFLLVGDGPLESELRERIRRDGLEQQVQMLGFRDDVPALLAAADVFLLPSAYESLPFALLEAMAAGKPVVASRTFGVQEAITNGTEGFLLEPGDIDGFVEAVLKLAKDPTLRESMGHATAHKVARLFSETAMLEQTIALVENIACPLVND